MIVWSFYLLFSPIKIIDFVKLSDIFLIEIEGIWQLKLILIEELGFRARKNEKILEILNYIGFFNWFKDKYKVYKIREEDTIRI